MGERVMGGLLEVRTGSCCLADPNLLCARVITQLPSQDSFQVLIMQTSAPVLNARLLLYVLCSGYLI